MNAPEATQLLDAVLDKLGEHFSSVQIVATLHESTGTRHYHRGTGDFYARRGAADKWLRDDEDSDHAYTESRIAKEEEKDDWQRGEEG